MVDTFLNWVKNTIQIPLDEASYRGQMGYVDPFEKQEVSKPKAGDIVISSPSSFLDKGKTGNSLRDIMPSLYVLSGDQDVNTQTYKGHALIPKRGMKERVFNADDILHDATYRYPEHERQLGNPNKPAAKVWLFIPPNAVEAKRKFLMRADKAAAKNVDPMQAAAAREDKDKLANIHVTNVLGGDVNKVMDTQAKAERGRYYRTVESQVRSMIQAKRDPNEVLKKVFSEEDPKDLQHPGFQDYLRRNQCPTLADYLAGKDITKLDGLQSPLEAMLMNRQAPEQTPGTIQYQRRPTSPVDQYRQAAATSRNPFAALDTPTPTSRVEHTDAEKVISEQKTYAYYPTNSGKVSELSLYKKY